MINFFRGGGGSERLTVPETYGDLEEYYNKTLINGAFAQKRFDLDPLVLDELHALERELLPAMDNPDNADKRLSADDRKRVSRINKIMNGRDNNASRRIDGIAEKTAEETGACFAGAR
ncbi:MAG: hypothetical protein UX30_C0004G0005 [Candidatus Saccharibacteria bacterium GW2011_GWA2_46_10]|nr:MAG: hypothetical protein UX30_C0004G0005 [Candidatus Saccharibacteria bacterium GW2011_GWA2_46_10]